MEYAPLVQERKSIRAFLKQSVPRELVEQVLDVAIKAPSALNLQPWEVTVVVGEEKERLGRILLKAYGERHSSCAPDTKGPLPDVLKKRGAASFDAMRPAVEELGLSFETFVNEGSCTFYGAPVAIIVCMHSVFSQTHYVCIGAMLAYLLLAAHDMGLGACPIGLLKAYEHEVLDFLNIPDDRELVIGVALGYPDWNSPLTAVTTPRVSLDEVVRWFD
jgi:nitroreductase